ncbi:MAG: hypothetical protein M3Z04_18585 [Chloroflexota bacterium]|nr:hypothetical protein [Chloroflexota bacterium]
MTTKEWIQSEVERMSDAELAKLYAYIQQSLPAPPKRYPNLLDALQDPELQIDAPTDFSVNWEQYVREWEDAENNIR